MPARTVESAGHPRHRKRDGASARRFFPETTRKNPHRRPANSGFGTLRGCLLSRKHLAKHQDSVPRTALASASILTAIASAAMLAARDPSMHPFAFLSPGLRVDRADVATIDQDDVFVRVLPGRGNDLAVAAAARTTATPDRLIAWMRRIESLQQRRYVPSLARFSTPPNPADVAGLVLDEKEFDDIRQCRPDDCGLKLNGAEIARLQAVAPGAGWKRDVEAAFRLMVLERARDYVADGRSDVTFAALAHHLGLRSPSLPGVADYLQEYPRLAHPDVVDSFLYWTRETFGFKPITSITHLTLIRSETAGMPRALAISKQVYANHYKDGALAVTAIVGTGSRTYLVYAHRSNVDVLDGLFGGLVRHVVERRVRDEAPAVLSALRTRLESGDPP